MLKSIVIILILFNLLLILTLIRHASQCSEFVVVVVVVVVLNNDNNTVICYCALPYYMILSDNQAHYSIRHTPLFAYILDLEMANKAAVCIVWL